MLSLLGFALLRLVSSETLVFSPLEGSAGLCSPRKLTVYNNSLFIAESGTGAEEINITNTSEYQCYDGSCLGRTSKVTAINLNQMGSEREDILVGLFSTRPLTGFMETHATGAQQATFDQNGVMYTVVGLGLNGTEMVADDVPDSIGDFGAIISGDGCEYDLWASPWIFEFENDYDA